MTMTARVSAQGMQLGLISCSPVDDLGQSPKRLPMLLSVPSETSEIKSLVDNEDSLFDTEDPT